MAHAARNRRRFTADEVLRMVDAGILAENEPLELIDGVLVEMSPQGPRHRARTVVVHQALERAFGPAFHVQDHSPVDAGPNSLPEPDVAVVRGAPTDFEDRHPNGADVPLVVEISVTSQTEDKAKAATYAGGRFPVYWILDVPARRLTVHSEPRAQQAEYAHIRIHTEEETIVVAEQPIRVGDLLPAQS